MRMLRKPIQAPEAGKTEGKAKGKKEASVVKTKPGTPNPLILARAHNNIGMTYFHMGVIPNAVHNFKKAVSFDPSSE